MEEDLEEEQNNYNALALQHAEKSFYDVIDHHYPCPPLSSTSSLTDYSSSSSSTTTTNLQNHTDLLPLPDSLPPMPIPNTHQLGLHYLFQFQPQQPTFFPLPRAVNVINIESDDDDDDVQDVTSSQVHVQNDDDNDLSELFDKLLVLGDKLEKQSLPSLQLHHTRVGTQTNYVDLRTLLMISAQAISSDDTSTASQLLKQIKQHSSPIGDATQRLAYFFGNALQARLNGNGSHIHRTLSSKTNSASDMIRAYQLYTSASPFEKLAIAFANNTISNLAKQSQTLHIIDFGVGYGFKWPAFIFKRLSNRPGGPPKLRITGIELPDSLNKVNETGRRLASYCNRFNVPFEFNGIAKKWETITVEDLKINNNEFLAVNCLFRFENLLDETVVSENPRDYVLDLIKNANPNIFVHSIVNGSYDAPYFVTRFREALYHYGALFDMLDDNNNTNIDREDPMRLMFEEEFWGKEVMNVVACEGCERVERPETYKQWQVRYMRSGFRSIPFDQWIIQKLKDRLRNDAYSSDFVLEVDGNWVLQGWKGRILYASSSWVPE